VGAGLAREGICAVIQLHRVAFIAGKPAPTGVVALENAKSPGSQETGLFA